MTQTAEPQKVTAFNFARAESDRYFADIVKRNGGLGALRHDREPTPINEQVVVRMNRDTLYSSAVYDLAAGPVTVTMPDNPAGRFQSMQAISQDHFTPFVIYDGRIEITEANIGTRYMLLAFRTYVNAADKSDLGAAHALQDGIKVAQVASGSFEIPAWDQTSLDEARTAFATLQSLGGVDDKVRMGTADEVDLLAHLMATATGWGLNPKSAAMYFTGYPTPNDADTVYRMVLHDVPADGFWSVSVYDKNGFFEKNSFDAYSVSNISAKADAGGSVTIQFGGCDGVVANCLPITDGWNYSLRLYRPRAEVQDGRWTPPSPEPVAQN